MAGYYQIQLLVPEPGLSEQNGRACQTIEDENGCRGAQVAFKSNEYVVLVKKRWIEAGTQAKRLVQLRRNVIERNQIDMTAGSDTGHCQ